MGIAYLVDLTLLMLQLEPMIERLLSFGELMLTLILILVIMMRI